MDKTHLVYQSNYHKMHSNSIQNKTEYVVYTEQSTNNKCRQLFSHKTSVKTVSFLWNSTTGPTNTLFSSQPA